MNERIYLDNAATSPLDSEVLESMIAVMQEVYGNPSSTHAHGRKAKNLIEESRGKIAKLLQCSPAEIIFTSGGTEADNIILRGCIKSLGIKNIVTSEIEHHAVLHTAQELEAEGLVKLHFVKHFSNGHVDLASLESILQKTENCLVSLMHANNELGNILDLEKAGEIAHRYGALFHSDTVQSMGQFPFNLSSGKVDFITGAAHKFNGPKGVGFYYAAKHCRPAALITGGAQERGLRGGTENVQCIVGMAKALEICYRDMDKKMPLIQGLKNEMIALLKKNIPNIEFNGDAEGNSLSTVLSVAFPESETGSMLLFNLDINGISASGGSACSSGSDAGSHVLKHLYPGSTRNTVRFSFGKYNTSVDIERTVETLKQWYPQLVTA